MFLQRSQIHLQLSWFRDFNTIEHRINILYNVYPCFSSRPISEFLLIKDSSRIPNVLWFEYVESRKESRFVHFHFHLCNNFRFYLLRSVYFFIILSLFDPFYCNRLVTSLPVIKKRLLSFSR